MINNLISLNILKGFDIFKSNKQKNKEEHWVTINGKHILIGEDGEIKRGNIGQSKKRNNFNFDKRKNTSNKKDISYLPTFFQKVMPEKFWNKLGHYGNINFVSEKNTNFGPYFSSTNKIFLTKGKTYYDKCVFIHELGHSLHTKLKIVTSNFVSPEFDVIFKSFLDEFNSQPDEIKEQFKGLNKSTKKALIKHEKLFNSLKIKSPSNENNEDKFVFFTDVIEALTEGKYGAGHGKDYFKQGFNLKYQELFANTFQSYIEKNEYFDLIFPNSIKKINDFYNKILS